jgi:lipopolysaccharide biosynthesis glycosyltransferase
VLARLLLDKLLPEDIHRIIYLDGDTIVRGDLNDLWNTEMGEKSIGACMEPTCSRKRKAYLGLKNIPYYNAGVLLIDLDNWRKNGTGKEIIDYYRAHDGRLFANDQDAINGSQKEKILSLSITYNYHNTYDIYRYRLLKKNCDYPVPEKAEVNRIKENPCIVHFLGEERPWRLGNKHRFSGDYIRYLDMTPWKGQNLEDGWKTYFTCWNIFNTVLKPFPMLRCNIINHLIPFVLKLKG